MSVPVECTCDGCGLTAKCGPSEPAPVGWFYITFEGFTVHACSEKCQRKAFAWKQHNVSATASTEPPP